MRIVAKAHLAIALGIVSVVGLSSSALAIDWPWSGRRAAMCQRCGQPVPRYTVMVPPGHSCPATVTVTPASPLLGQPSTSTSGQLAPQPGAPYSGSPSTPPGMDTGAPGMDTGAPNTGQPAPADTTQPGATDATQPGAGGATPPGMTSGLGGGLGEAQGALNMFGDAAPLSRIAILQVPNAGFVPPPPPEPPSGRPVRFPPDRYKSATFVPSVRSFKFADNQTPMPVDRITYSFNFFDYVNQSVNQRNDVPLERIQAWRHVLGFEKTLFDKNASFGMRLPINTLSANSTVPNLGSTSTSVGDLAMFFKYALYIDRAAGRVVSTGMAVTVPTGPATFGGANYLRGIHYTNLQPYFGVQWTWGDLYAINFSSIDVPMSSRDVTIFYEDIGIGYYVYRNGNSTGLIQAVAPTFETHINTPFNHTNPFNRSDLAATSQVVDLTEGINVFFRNKSVLSLGIVEPITGPRPFSVEALALFNVFF